MRTLLILSILFSFAASAEEYTHGVDSQLQEGVPQGTIEKHTWDTSNIYPGTTTDYWVYVPTQYTKEKPACLMVFQDGQAYLYAEGPVRAPIVFDNLIHKQEMPVTIGVFVSSGKKERPGDQREVRYVTVDDTYARFLLEEIIPEVEKDYNLVDDPSGRAIAGASDGGLVSFTVAWHRPDAFSKVISHIGSFVGSTGLRLASKYPDLIRQTRGNPKPIRVFLQDGANDINLSEGNWTLGNINMESALMFSRYDYDFVMGTGGHSTWHGGAIFPDTLRWIWRDYPGVKSKKIGNEAIVGTWDVVTNIYGVGTNQQLVIGEEDNELTAILKDGRGKDIEVSSFSFRDNILSYEYSTSSLAAKLGYDYGTFKTWLRVKDDSFRGAASAKANPGDKSTADHSVKGQRRPAS